MSGAELEFYADCQDLEALLAQLDRVGKFKYTLANGLLNAALVQHSGSSGLLKYATTPLSPYRGYGYVVTDIGKDVVFRKSNMLDGSGFKFFSDQAMNPQGIQFALGGEAGDNTLVGGIIATTGDTQRSREIFKIFEKIICKMSRQVAHVRVLPGALLKLESGWRLTVDPAYSHDMDIKLRPSK